MQSKHQNSPCKFVHFDHLISSHLIWSSQVEGRKARCGIVACVASVLPFSHLAVGPDFTSVAVPDSAFHIAGFGAKEPTVESDVRWFVVKLVKCQIAIGSINWLVWVSLSMGIASRSQLFEDQFQMVKFVSTHAGWQRTHLKGNMTSWRVEGSASSRCCLSNSHNRPEDAF